MKSRISSCKATALGKDLTRFWPVWAGYTLFLIFIQVILGSESREYWYLANLTNSIALMAMANCAYGFLAAVMLFGDLFNTRLCNGLHSLPLRREHWFGAHLKAGMLFSLVPTTLMTVFIEAAMVSGTIIENGWQLPLYWWLGVNLQFLFFFGLAVFCVMCTGSRFAAAVVYGGLNCFSLLVWLLVDQFYAPLLHGVIPQTYIFKLLSPVWWLTSNELIKTNRIKTGQTYMDEFGTEQTAYTGKFTLNGEEWGYLAVLVVISIVLLLLARQMYKKRNLECAGDFMAVKWLEPVFQVVFTVMCAIGVHGIFYTLFGYRYHDSYVMAILGLVAGWFAGRMFLEGNTRVLRLKNVAGLLLLAAVLAGSLVVTKLDPLGIEDWVPEAGKVAKAQMTLSHRTSVETENPEEIADFLGLHQLALEEKITVEPDYDDYFYNENADQEPVAFVNLTYWLENGLTAERQYYIRPQSEAGDIAREYASRLVEVIDQKETIKEADDLHHAMRKATTVAVAGKPLDEQYLQEAFLLKLVDAIQADCEAGTMVQSAVYHPEYIFGAEGEEAGMQSLHLELSSENFFCYLNVYADCENTMALLESTGIIDTIRMEVMPQIKG